jgi:anti-sigma regulatory factor (Ser/Thr protein kinase)
VPRRVFPADVRVLRQLRNVVRRDLSGAGVDAEALDDVVLCVHEACMNAVQHGRGELHLRWNVAPEEVVVEVCDQGSGTPPSSGHDEPGAEQLSGRGLFLIRRLTHRFATSVDGAWRCLAFAVPLRRAEDQDAALESAGFATAN